ncbi:MAG: hypothetical protein HUU46_14045 [Candidatus Hydrogenedentes bacterium]|nr:hypothetical protein [Candidatus Hydrogenedentota bacterium]
MTQALEKAIAALQVISDEEQDAIAALIMEELADEQRWDDAFSNSQEVLSRMTKEAREDAQYGRVREAGIDELRSRS